MNREQGLQLGHAEPEAGQLELIAIRPVEDIAIMLSVKMNRGSLLNPQLMDDPIDGGPGALHAFFQLAHGNRITVGMQEGVQLVNAVKLVHCFLRQKDEKGLATFTFRQCHRRKQEFYAKTQKTHGGSYAEYFAPKFEEKTDLEQKQKTKKGASRMNLNAPFLDYVASPTGFEPVLSA